MALMKRGELWYFKKMINVQRFVVSTGFADRKSAEAGDFRGQRSLASVLLEAGFTDEAAYWLRRAAVAKRIAYR